jgi:two-component system, NtrC family, response regulator AtoC
LTLNCAAIPSELAESELFGHERGAFTTALSQKKGLVELADGGTLFLNEIGELTLPIQSKLLTFLDTREFMRVGGETNRKADVRILAATNRDLEREMSEKRFREDLFYRLNIIRIFMPPLRERKEDIAILAQQFLAELNTEYDEERDIDPNAIRLLEEYDYQGNVRQLKNLFRRARVFTNKQTIDAKSIFGDLAEQLKLKVRQPRPISEGDNSEDWEWRTDFPGEKSYNQVVLDLRRSLIKEALRRAGGSPTQAARLLGMTKDAMIKQIKTLAIQASIGHPE